MASLAMKKKVERRVRQLLREDGLSQPDEVAYGPSSVTLFWHSTRKSVDVDVDEHGEVGMSRIGPRHPSWDEAASSSNGHSPPVPATLAQKIACERDVRAMLEDHGLTQPDEVEYGYGCIRLLWTEEKFCLVVDITDPPPGPVFPEDIDQLARAPELGDVPGGGTPTNGTPVRRASRE